MDRYAEFKDVPLSAPGTYKLIIKGGAEGTPDWGFSNYGSLGVYGISGDVTGSISNGGISVSIVQFNPFPTVCEEIDPSIEVLNAGQSPITSLEITYSIDGVIQGTIQESKLQLPSGAKADIDLPLITQQGVGVNYKAFITKVNGASINSSPLTEKEIKYTLGSGSEMELIVPSDAADNFTWEIKNTSGAIVANKTYVAQTIKDGGTETMRFCLAEDCYQMELPAPGDLCSSYEQWTSSKNYGQQGTLVYHTLKDDAGNFILYSNKWWAGGNNVPGGGDPWEEIGVCSNSTASSGTFVLKSKGGSGNLIESTFGGANDPLEHDFCSSGITSSTLELNQLSLNFGPNPFSDQLGLFVTEGFIKNLSIYDLTGKLVSTQNVKGSKVTIGERLKSGVYIIQLNTSKGPAQIKVVKK